MNKLPLLVPLVLLERKLFIPSRMMGLMGLALFIVMLAVPLSFAVPTSYPFLNDWSDYNTTYYNVTYWTQSASGANCVYNYYGYFIFDQSKVLNPVATNTVLLTMRTSASPYSVGVINSVFNLIHNNSWLYSNQTPTGVTVNLWTGSEAFAGASTKTYTIGSNLPAFYDQLYRFGDLTGWYDCGTVTSGSPSAWTTYGTGQYSSAGYPKIVLDVNTSNFFTKTVSMANPSKHVYFDFESGSYTQCNDTSCYFDEADMHWGREYNIVNDMPVGSDGMIPDSSDAHTLNDLNAISCSSYAGFYEKYAAYYSTVECTDYPAQCNYYIYCFNQSTGHGGNQFYGVVKFLNATDNNLTFYYALYSGSENLEIAGFDYYPVPVVSSNSLTTYWHTGVASDTRLFYRNRHGNGTWQSWHNVYNPANVTTHLINISSSSLYAGYEYQVYAYSVAGNATGQSDIYQFNVTGVVPTTTTTTTTLPYGSDTANAGMIQSVSYSDRYPAIDQTIRIDIYITNNGTRAGNYSVGLSIGNVTSGVWCNRDCYDDGLGAYGHTGKVEVGSTVMVTRYYKFRHEFFLPSRNYSIAVGVYPYDYSATSFDYDIFSNAITTKSITELAGGGKIAYPISVSVTPVMTRRGGEVKVTSYVLNNGTAPYTFKLGMSLGIWDKNESVIYNATEPALIHPCNVECYTDDLGDWVNIEIPPNYTAPFTRTFTIPDYFLENTSYDVAVGVYIGDALVAIRYFDNKGFVQIGASSGQPQEILEPTGAMVGALLGITTSSGVLLIIFIIVMGVGIYASYKTKHAEIGVMVMVLMIIAFFIAGKIPLWIMILVVVIASAIVARMFGNIFGGGG